MPADRKRKRQATRLRWLLGIYMQDVEGVLELVHNLHAPLPIWLELAVQTLQRPASHDGRFVPGSVFIRQFLTHEIEFGTVVVDMEKVPWHGKESRDAGTSSSRVSCSLAAHHGSNIAQIPPARRPLSSWRLRRVRLFMCRFSAAGMQVYRRAEAAGGRKAPRHEVAGG